LLEVKISVTEVNWKMVPGPPRRIGEIRC
jgi:hypothetical protein